MTTPRPLARPPITEAPVSLQASASAAIPRSRGLSLRRRRRSKTLRWCVCALLSVALTTTALLAKGVTTRIVMTGGNLTAPLHITDPAVLRGFNVWAGRGTYMNGVEGTQGFIIDWPSWPQASRPDGLTRYQVSFFVRFVNRPLESQADQLAYVVDYEWDAVEAKGYVYLPGPADEFFRLNTSSIHRNGMNGRWFRSTEAWQDTLAPLLKRHVGQRENR
jgi:hypothetical protein